MESSKKPKEGGERAALRPQRVESEYFIGSAGADQAAINAYYVEARKGADYLGQWPGRLSIPEVERKMEVAEAAIDHYSWTQLGVDLSERDFNTNSLFVFNEDTFSQIKKENGKRQMTLAFVDGAGTVICTTDLSQREYLLYILQHELNHVKEFRQVQLDRDAEGKAKIRYTRQGLSLENSFVDFNEMVLEAFNQEIVTKYPDINPLIDLEAVRAHTYEGFVTAFNGLIVPTMAKRLDEKPEQIKKEFFRARFTGDWGIMKKVEQTFGAESLRHLSVMAGGRGPNDAVETMKKLGFTWVEWND